MSISRRELDALPPEVRRELRIPRERPTPLTEPLCYASGYTLHLYCDHKNDLHDFDEFPHQYTGDTFAECARAARKRGWTFHYSARTATCPKCNGKPTFTPAHPAGR